jgi:hypothetical protein
MYSPRDEFLAAVQQRLTQKGIHLEINGDKAGTSNDQYWDKLVDSDIILTTTLQGPQRSYMDWVWIRQAVFRYSETLAAGTALVAGPVDGGFQYFESGRDFLEFESVDECVAALFDLTTNSQKLTEISQTGHQTVKKYVEQGTFWHVVLAALKN